MYVCDRSLGMSTNILSVIVVVVVSRSSSSSSSIDSSSRTVGAAVLCAAGMGKTISAR